MEENQRAALIMLLKIGEGMVNPMKIEDWTEQQHNNEQMLLAILDLLDVFMVEPDVREVIDLAMEAKKLSIEEGETLGEGPRKLQRDINLFSMYKRLGRLISRIEAAQAPNLVNPLGGGVKTEAVEDNGCNKGTKPYKVKYRIIREGETNVCIDKEDDTLDLTMDALAMRAWNLGDFEVVIIGKKIIKHIDE